MCFEIIVGVSREKGCVLFSRGHKAAGVSTAPPAGPVPLAPVGPALQPLPVDKYLNYMCVNVQSNLKGACSSSCHRAVSPE